MAKRKEFQKTCDFIYSLAAIRVKKKKNFLKKTSYNLAGYDSKDDMNGKKERKEKNQITGLDPDMFNKIATNTRGKNNRYLIRDLYIEPLCAGLNLNKNELLWGGEWEVNEVAGTLFNSIILDLQEQDRDDINNLLETLFVDYVSYSKQSSYRQLVEDGILSTKRFTQEDIDFFDDLINDDISLASEIDEPNVAEFRNILLWYLGVYGYLEYKDRSEYEYDDEDIVIDKDEDDDFDKPIDITSSLYSFSYLKSWLPYFQNEATGRLFLFLKESFIAEFKDFFYQIESFKFLTKTIEQFANERFIPMLKEYIGYTESGELDIEGFRESSLGFRVQNIINTDIHQLSEREYRRKQNLPTETFFPKQKKYEKAYEIDKVYGELLKNSKEAISILGRVQYLTDRGIYSNSPLVGAEIQFEKALLNDWEKKYISQLQNKKHGTN